MAALPKKRPSKVLKRDRLFQIFKTYEKKSPKLQRCPKCGAWVAPHKMCVNCGTYRNVQVVNFDKRKDRYTRKIERLKAQQG